MKKNYYALLVAVMVCFTLLLSACGESDKVNYPGTPLAYELVDMKVNSSVPGRDRLYVTVAATGPQEQATQKDLVSTAMAAALNYHKEAPAPVTVILLQSQNTGSVWADKTLATITYTPDEKGYSGQDTTPKFFDARACKRGFTQDELTYLHLWSELRQKYLDPRTDGVALDKEEILETEIEEKMGKKLPSDPMFNIPEYVELVSK